MSMMPKGRKGAAIALVLIAVLVIGGGTFVYLERGSDDEGASVGLAVLFSSENATVNLNTAETRRDVPLLAEALDEAVASYQAGEPPWAEVSSDEDEIRRICEYLDEKGATCGEITFGWRGYNFIADVSILS